MPAPLVLMRLVMFISTLAVIADPLSVRAQWQRDVSPYVNGADKESVRTYEEKAVVTGRAAAPATATAPSGIGSQRANGNRKRCPSATAGWGRWSSAASPLSGSSSTRAACGRVATETRTRVCTSHSAIYSSGSSKVKPRTLPPRTRHRRSVAPGQLCQRGVAYAREYFASYPHAGSGVQLHSGPPQQLPRASCSRTPTMLHP